MWEKIQEETVYIENFAEKHNLKWDNYSTNWFMERFPGAQQRFFKAEPNLKDSIKVCYITIK
jgi:hypothetical protein